MTFTKPDTAYWDRKFIAYMHDPLDKILQIKGHEERAALMLEKYGIQKPNEEFWKKADAIAAGFERGQVPSYRSDSNRNGAVDFLKSPIITHPTSKKAHLRISVTTNDEAANQINEKLLQFMESEIGMKAGQGGYSDKFKGDDARFAVARFLYTHLMLRFKLSEHNIGGLGAFWHRIPADSRFPDHSIWQHNVLCSALNSCIELSGGEPEIGMMVFSITPAQPFISKARKSRDYWTGSVLLSWLAFEGMCWIIENLGPDHILYPSLIDQPLVNEYLKINWEISQDGFLNPRKDIASFPNKFLFLIPMNHAESIAGEIKSFIQSAWKELYEKVCSTCTGLLESFLSEDEKGYIREIFDRQNKHFWELQWTAAFLATGENKDEIKKLLPDSVSKNPFALLERFNAIIEDKPHYDKSGRGILYSVTHSLAQSALAASKNRKSITRLPETGEKCHLCGEFEIVHHRKYSGDISAREYKENAKVFWDTLKLKWDGDKENKLGYNLNRNEKLCSICLTKRMVGKALKENSGHILFSAFKGSEGFPSTTEIALHNHYERIEVKECRLLSKKERRDIAQRIHEKADEKTYNQDRYFAILLMDGDKMGDLINGITLASTWESIMHPEIVARLNKPEFEKSYHENWKEIFNKKRLVTPAIHAAISESLGDFSLYGVDHIVKKNHGTLIYAGGDDVCAILPVLTSFKAAQEIQQYYKSTYKWIQKDKDPEDVFESFTSTSGKLSINLGNGDYISISAGILICHHKESLSQMIKEAHHLLDEKAKKEAGRNACAIELRKRSGGSRYFVRRWDGDNEKTWKSFAEIGDAIKSKNKAQVSASVVYRLEQLRPGIEAILKHENWREMLERLIFKQLERSSIGDKENKKDFAKKMIDLAVFEDSEGNRNYEPGGLIVAAFMAKGGDENGMV